MATDDLLDDNKDSSTDKPAAAPTVSKDDISAAVKAGLSEFGGQLGQFAKDVGAHVKGALDSAQTKVDRGTATKKEEDLVQTLLTDPEKAIAKVVQEQLASQLGPYLQTQINDNYEGLVEKHRERIDKQYGDGTFDEIILPDLEATVKAGNPAAKASKEYVATVVRGIVGHENVQPKLDLKKDAMKAKREAEEKESDIPVGILDGGRRKPGKLALSDDDRAFINHRAGEGVKIDPKVMEAALKVRAEQGSWTADNFPGLKTD
jgi:hypothetical protein